jgi:hypothetical protein
MLPNEQTIYLAGRMSYQLHLQRHTRAGDKWLQSCWCLGTRGSEWSAESRQPAASRGCVCQHPPRLRVTSTRHPSFVIEMHQDHRIQGLAASDGRYNAQRRS